MSRPNLKFNKSMDDIHLNRFSYHERPERRSRSQSPNKNNRKSLPPGFEMKLPSLPYVYLDDLRSLSSLSSSNNSGLSSISSEQLKILSKSPLSKKLHINTAHDGHHVIPIPFTINLPPKLSPKNIKLQKSRSSSPEKSLHSNNSRNNSRSPSPKKSGKLKLNGSRLVFTGNGYEKIDTSSSDNDTCNDENDADFDIQREKQIELAKRRSIELNSKSSHNSPNHNSFNNLPNSPPDSPISSKRNGPPSVNANKRKSVKTTLQARNLNSDELSIIEEQSISNNSSRNSSVRATAVKENDDVKSLPPTPKPLEGIQELSTPISSPEKAIERGRERPVNPLIATPTRQIINNDPIILNNDQLLHSPQNSLKPRTISAPAPSSRSNSPVRTNIKMMNNKGMISHESLNKDLPPIGNKIHIPRHVTEGNLNLLKNSNAPMINHGQVLQIQKRSFSDESHVSSVSSFSTVADTMSFSSKFKSDLKNRNASSQSVESIGSSDSTISRQSNESWNSVQKSIDLTITGSDEECEQDQEREPEHSINSIALKPAETSQNQIIHKSVNASIPKVTNSDNIEHSREVTLANATTTETETETECEGSEVDDYYLSPEKDNEQPETPKHQLLKDIRDNKESGTEWESTSESDSNLSQETIEFRGNENLNKGMQSLKNIDQIMDYKDNKDNKGAGKHFNFPNNNQNVTNSDITKKRIISTDTYKSGKSRYSYFSAIDGQIEIPDLSEASFSEAGTIRKEAMMNVNGTTFKDLVSDSENETLEPIGVPSQKGRRIVTETFKHLYDSDGDDSDFGSTNFSLYSNNIKSKSTSNLASKALPPLPNLTNDEIMTNKIQTPMRTNIRHERLHSRHSRHKSLGNIDFNLDELTSPTKPKDQDKGLPATPLNTQIDHHGNNREKVEQVIENDLNIKVAEPPKPINYKVDFKEAVKERNEFRLVTPTMNELNKIKSIRQSKKQKSFSKFSSSSDTSYQSSRSAKQSQSTDLSDTESVMIDLTKEKYDICTIQRNNSTQSYRSVTESYNGKEVEVVIVDEEEDERDLESIYSKYGKNWLGRSDSVRSSGSTTSSTFSYNSMASESQIRLKATGPNLSSLKNINSKLMNNSTTSSLSSKYNSRRIKLPPKVVEEEEQYFDYSKSSSYYDFNSFINGKKDEVNNLIREKEQKSV